MKISRFYALVVVVLLSSLAAFASSVNDPKVIIHGVDSGNAPSMFAHCPPQGCTGVGMNFSFSVPSNKSATGTLFFTNTSGKNWTSLTLIERGIPASAISCAQNVFLSCTTTTREDGSVAILLSGVKGGGRNPQVGIPAGTSFSIRFQCVTNSDGTKGCWVPGQTITGHAGAVPEPGTMALLITGVGAIFSRRKLWKKNR